MRTSLTVPPTVLRTRCTSSSSRTTPSVRRVPVAFDEKAAEVCTSMVARTTAVPMSRAVTALEALSRRRPGSLRGSRSPSRRSRMPGNGSRNPRGVSVGGAVRETGRSIGSITPAASVSARSPSASAWWNLNRTANEVPSAPGRTCASHGGLARSSGRSMRAPADAWKSAVGSFSRTWSSGSKSGTGTRAAPPTGIRTPWMRIRSPGTAGARAARSSTACRASPGDVAANTPNAPRCIGCSAVSMFQNARSSGARRSGLGSGRECWDC